MLYKKVKTPCVGICSTVFGDNVCRGCKRFVHEVIDWNHYSELQKQLVWQRLEHLLQRVVEQYLAITDAQLLNTQLSKLGIAHPAELNAHCKAFYFLKATHQQINADMTEEQFGFRILVNHRHQPLSEIFNQLASQYWELSKAYYDATVARTFSIPENQQAQEADLPEVKELTHTYSPKASPAQAPEIERES